MLEYKVNTDVLVPVKLTNTVSGLAHTGVAFGSVSVTVVKSNGSTASYTPTAPQWTEIAAGAYSGGGYYNLVIPLADTDQVGILQYAVSVAGDDLYFGVVNIVASLESDTFTAVARLLALSYDNINEDQQVYDTGKRLTSARFRAYDTAAHALAGGVTGLLYTYAIAAAYDGSGNCTSFTMTRNP